MKPGLYALVVAVLATVAAPVAFASTRIAVAAFDGDRTGDLQDIVIEILEADYRVLPPRDVTRAIDKLGLDDVENNKALAKLAAELDSDAVIVGAVEPDGNKSKLTIRVYIRAKKRAFQMTARYTNPKQVRDSTLKEDLRTALGPGGGDDATDGGGDGDSGKGHKRSLRHDQDDDRGDRGDGDDRGDDRGDGDDGDRDGKRHRTARRDDGDDGDREVDEGSDDDDDGGGRRHSRHSTGIRTARNAGVRFEVGVSGTGRQLTFVSNLQPMQAPPNYKSSLVPGLRIHGELYPLALQNPDTAAAGFGLAGDFDRALGLTTTSSNLMDHPLTTKSQMWQIGLVYRIAYGKRLTNPSFTLGVGYGKRQFTIDRGPLMGMPLDLPDVVYKYIVPSISARIPIVPTAALTATGRFLAMRDTGPIGKADQYGQAKVTGIDIEAGLEVQLGRYVVLHLAGVFTQIGFTFQGTGGDAANSRDGNPNTLDVGGARDRFFGATGAIGVVY